MNLALLQGIRLRYPEWQYMIDGDGGDENLKDYKLLIVSFNQSSDQIVVDDKNTQSNQS